MVFLFKLSNVIQNYYTHPCEFHHPWMFPPMKKMHKSNLPRFQYGVHLSTSNSYVTIKILLRSIKRKSFYHLQYCTFLFLKIYICSMALGTPWVIALVIYCTSSSSHQIFFTGLEIKQQKMSKGAVNLRNLGFSNQH